jgi:bla regulator protein blaR1
MLIDVGQRPSVYVGAVAAMSESRSFLEERITIMVRDPARWGTVATVLFGCLALALVAVAAQVTPPNVSHSAGSESQAVSVAPEVLERYVGCYVRGGHQVLVITREGSKLFAQTRNLPTVELNADRETDFRISVNTSVQFSFVLDEEGQVTGFIEHVDRPKYSFTWPRVDAATAQQILANNQAKFQSQTPTPGSEAALRRAIDALRIGKCIDDEMAPWFAKLCEETLSDLHWNQAYVRWGAVQSIKFSRVEETGGDVYEVRQEHGRSKWMIYLNASGIIEDGDNQRIGE